MRPSTKLEIDQDLTFQRREWRMQRIGRGLLIAVVGAALAGLFGGGPLSSARARTPDGRIDVRFERFLRFRAPTRIEIALQPLPAAGPIELRLARGYFDGLRLVQAVPEWEGIDIGERDVALRFAAPRHGGPFTLVIDVEPIRPGRLAGALHLTDGSRVAFTQFVYF